MNFVHEVRVEESVSHYPVYDNHDVLNLKAEPDLFLQPQKGKSKKSGYLSLGL